MSKREIVGAVTVAVLAGLLTWAGGQFWTTYEEGEEATTDAHIVEVLENTLDEKLKVTINGETKTMGEAISLMNERQVRMEEALKALTE